MIGPLFYKNICFIYNNIITVKIQTTLNTIPYHIRFIGGFITVPSGFTPILKALPSLAPVFLLRTIHSAVAHIPALPCVSRNTVYLLGALLYTFNLVSVHALLVPSYPNKP